MRFFICTVVLFMSQANMAQEFIQQHKPKRISLQNMKEEAGDLFAQQLRESAEIVQLLGRVQLACVKSDAQIKSETQRLGNQRLKETGTQLRNYSLQLADLLHPMVFTQAIYFPDTISFVELIAELTTIMGVIQQHIIDQLNGLIEDTNSLFIKKHAHALPGVVASIKSYTPHLCVFKNILTTIENKQHQVATTGEINKKKSLSNMSLSNSSLSNSSLVKS